MTAIQAFCKRTGRKEYDTSAYKLDREATKAFLAWTRTKDPSPEADRTRAEMEAAIKLLNDYGEAWSKDNAAREATADLCEYAKTGQI